MPSGGSRPWLVVIGIGNPTSTSPCCRSRTASPDAPLRRGGAFWAADWSRALPANRGERRAMGLLRVARGTLLNIPIAPATGHVTRIAGFDRLAAPVTITRRPGGITCTERVVARACRQPASEGRDRATVAAERVPAHLRPRRPGRLLLAIHDLVRTGGRARTGGDPLALHCFRYADPDGVQ